MPQALMVASAVIGTAGTVYSVAQQKKAARASQRQQELQNRASKRQAIREAQIRKASTTQEATASGAQFGSGLAGGISSLGSQLGSTLGFSSVMSGLNKTIAMAGARADFGAAVGNLGFKAFDTLGGPEWLKGKVTG